MRILYVENHPHFVKAVAQFLATHDVVVVDSLLQAKAAVLNQRFDIALVDYDLNDGKGDEFVKFVVKSNLRLPIIACSSHDKGNNALMRAGAQATCAKMQFKDIDRVIESVCRGKPYNR